MSQPDFSLILCDELLCLALNSQKGRFDYGQQLSHLFAGALLLELTIEGRLDRDGRASFLVINSTPDAADPLVNWALEKLFKQVKHRYIKYWIKEQDGFADLKDHLLERHLETGLLTREERRSRLTFSMYDFWVCQIPEYRETLIDQVKTGADGSTPTDIRTYCLIKLIRAFPHLFGHIIEPEDWDGVAEPTLEDEGFNLALIENICSILRATLLER